MRLDVGVCLVKVSEFAMTGEPSYIELRLFQFLHLLSSGILLFQLWGRDVIPVFVLFGAQITPQHFLGQPRFSK